MASSKRRPDKSKRYRQNKAQREARAARSARAGEATAVARGERVPASAPAEDTTDAPRARNERAEANEADTTKATSGRPTRRSRYTIPGQRAVVLAFMFTIVSAATLLIAPIQVPRDVPADDPRVEADDERNDDGTVTIFEDGKLVEEEPPAVAAVVLLTPIAITGGALWFTKRPRRSTAWSVAMVLMAAYVFFVGSYGVISLPSLIALAVAGFQSRRVEAKTRMAEIKADRAARAGDDAGADDGDGEVIDVDAVEEPSDADHR